MPVPEHDRQWSFVPLLAAQCVLGTAALAAITLSIDEPVYSALVHLALVGGFLWSYFGLRSGRGQVWPGVMVMLGAFTFYAMRYYYPPFLLLFFPSEVLASSDMSLAVLVGWFLVGFAFWQGNRSNFIFCVVCGLAVFGLMGTINLNPELWVAFSVFVLCTIFAWGYERFLDMAERLPAAASARLGAWREMARAQLSVAMLVAVLTLVLGSLLGLGAYTATPNMYARMARHAYGWQFPGMHMGSYDGFANAFRVGTGPIHLSPDVVMTVHADRPALWRGMVYDTYDGRGWSRAYRHPSLLTESGDEYLVPARFLPRGPGVHVNHQTVTTKVPTMVAAGQPSALKIPASDQNDPWDNYPRIDGYGCLSWAGLRGAGTQTYQVTSLEPPTDPAILRAAPPPSDQGGDLVDYLQVPQPTKNGLTQLVRDLTANATTNYDKVMALQRYLETHCMYSLEAPAVPYRQDAVMYFITHSHRGACDLFATALAVMCRVAGIPARLATGYATGQYDRATDSYVVRGTDAHAWVEVRFAGVGWVPFSPQATTTYEQESLTELWRGGHWDLVVRQVLGQTERGLAIVLIVFLALGALIDPWHLVHGAVVRQPQTPLRRLAREYQKFYQSLLRRTGERPTVALTPQEAVSRAVAGLAQVAPSEAARLAGLNERFYQARYAAEINDEEVARLRRDLAALRRQFKHRR